MHVVFLMFDSLNRRALSTYGGVIPTPNHVSASTGRAHRGIELAASKMNETLATKNAAHTWLGMIPTILDGLLKRVT